jgi:hypothetical protein
MSDVTIEKISTPTSAARSALDPNVEKRAHDLYAIYCAFSGGLSWDGRPCPVWSKLGEKVQLNWYGVALRSIQLTLSDPGLEQLGEEKTNLPSDTVFGMYEGDDGKLRQMMETWERYSR